MIKAFVRIFAVVLAAALPALHGEFKQGRGEFKLNVYGKPAYKKHPVRLDPGKAYLLTGTYRTEGPATEVSLGMELRDADGFPLRAVMYTGIPGSETELVAPSPRAIPRSASKTLRSGGSTQGNSPCRSSTSRRRSSPRTKSCAR